MADAPRILIVEDESGVRRLFEQVLSEDGYLVTSVATGRHALLVSRDVVFDLAIVDMSLPDLEGPDVIRRILEEAPHIKAIAVSGLMEGPMRTLAALAGAIAVFQKPITPKTLREGIFAVLDPSLSWRAKGAN